MVSRLIFKKRQNLDKILTKYSEIVTVQSEVVTSAVYGIADHKFAILLPEGAVFCPIHEVPKLAKQLIPGLSKEVMDVFNEWGKAYDTRR